MPHGHFQQVIVRLNLWRTWLPDLIQAQYPLCDTSPVGIFLKETIRATRNFYIHHRHRDGFFRRFPVIALLDAGATGSSSFLSGAGDFSDYRLDCASDTPHYPRVQGI